MDLGWLNLCICNEEKISYGLGKYCVSMRRKLYTSFQCSFSNLSHGHVHTDLTQTGEGMDGKFDMLRRV